MHPVEQGPPAFLQGFGGGDIGQDHELLDQAMRLQPLADRDRRDLAVRVQFHLALGQVQIQRLAPGTGACHRAVGREEGPDHRFSQGRGHLVRFAIRRCLHLRVVQ